MKWIDLGLGSARVVGSYPPARSLTPLPHPRKHQDLLEADEELREARDPKLKKLTETDDGPDGDDTPRVAKIRIPIAAQFRYGRLKAYTGRHAERAVRSAYCSGEDCGTSGQVGRPGQELRRAHRSGAIQVRSPERTPINSRGAK